MGVVCGYHVVLDGFSSRRLRRLFLEFLFLEFTNMVMFSKYSICTHTHLCSRRFTEAIFRINVRIGSCFELNTALHTHTHTHIYIYIGYATGIIQDWWRSHMRSRSRDRNIDRNSNSARYVQRRHAAKHGHPLPLKSGTLSVAETAPYSGSTSNLPSLRQSQSPRHRASRHHNAGSDGMLTLTPTLTLTP